MLLTHNKNITGLSTGCAVLSTNPKHSHILAIVKESKISTSIRSFWPFFYRSWRSTLPSGIMMRKGSGPMCFSVPLTNWFIQKWDTRAWGLSLPVSQVSSPRRQLGSDSGWSETPEENLQNLDNHTVANLGSSGRVWLLTAIRWMFLASSSAESARSNICLLHQGIFVQNVVPVRPSSWELRFFILWVQWFLQRFWMKLQRSASA